MMSKLFQLMSIGVTIVSVSKTMHYIYLMVDPEKLLGKEVYF